MSNTRNTKKVYTQNAAPKMNFFTRKWNTKKCIFYWKNTFNVKNTRVMEIFLVRFNKKIFRNFWRKKYCSQKQNLLSICRDKPKSDIFAIRKDGFMESWATITLRAAKSRWILFFECKYCIPSQIWIANNTSCSLIVSNGVVWKNSHLVEFSQRMLVPFFCLYSFSGQKIRLVKTKILRPCKIIL